MNDTRDSGPFAGSQSVGAETVPCPGCGGRATTTATGQCAGCGRFLPGNAVALKHGARRAQLTGGTAEDAERRQEIRDAVIADAGGEVAAAMLAIIEDFSAAVVICERASAYLEQNGPMTANGKRRPAVDLWLASSARVERLAKLIGVKAKAKNAPSLREVMSA